MSKNIVLLSDGTGNSSSKLFKTNVWRLFQALDLTDASKQVAYYDNGVGTSSFKWWAAFAGIFGIGLKRNILDIYCFCSRNYREGDRIFGFGFSRGAFTIRVVAGLIASIGLAPYDNDEAKLRAMATVALREYRKRGTQRTMARYHLFMLRAIRDFFSRNVMRKPSFEDIRFVDPKKIEFLGVWDTVDAYGGPIEEIVRAIDYWYWPLSLPDRFMNAKIQRACHALALEDERDAFKPVLWDDRYVKSASGLFPMDHEWTPPVAENGELAAIDRERMSQVWFVGVHSDIGGGYPQDGLAHFTLDWMIDRARLYGILLLAQRIRELAPQVDRFDKLNDSRSGIGAYYRYRPRKLEDIYKQPPYRLSVKEDWRRIKRLFNKEDDPELEVKRQLAFKGEPVERPDPKIHDAVFERVDACTDGYSPIVIPKIYCVTDKSGSIRGNPRETPVQALWRANRQEAVWDIVWKRRVIYFATMFGFVFLLGMPLLQRWPGLGVGSPFAFLIPIVDAAAHYLPNLLKPWFDAFRDAPERLFAGIVYVGLLSMYGSTLQGRIRDRMRVIWKTPTVAAPQIQQSFIYRLRNAGAYKASYYVLKHWILPTIFALLIAVLLLAVLWCAVAGVSRAVFMAYDVMGNVCTPSTGAKDITAGSDNRPPVKIDTRMLCNPTGLIAKKGLTYDVSLVVTDGWEDGHRWDEPQTKGIETDPNGFGLDKMTRTMALGLPYRRLISPNWLATVFRIGEGGFGEVVLNYESDECTCPRPATRYKASFKAAKDGEVFVYVNDSIISWLGLERFYRNNKGTADLTITLRPSNPE